MTIGILPTEDRIDANPFVDVAIATGMGEMRNALIVRTVDAVVAVGGEYGTLSEIAFALRIGRPVVTLGSWGLTKPDGAPADVLVTDTPEAAVEAAFSAARARPA